MESPYLHFPRGGGGGGILRGLLRFEYSRGGVDLKGGVELSIIYGTGKNLPVRA
jgi:hypothetical protein